MHVNPHPHWPTTCNSNSKSDADYSHPKGRFWKIEASGVWDKYEAIRIEGEK